MDDFELVLWSSGSRGKSYPLCPYCYNHPPFRDMKKGKYGTWLFPASYQTPMGSLTHPSLSVPTSTESETPEILGPLLRSGYPWVIIE